MPHFDLQTPLLQDEQSSKLMQTLPTGYREELEGWSLHKMMLTNHHATSDHPCQQLPHGGCTTMLLRAAFVASGPHTCSGLSLPLASHVNSLRFTRRHRRRGMTAASGDSPASSGNSVSGDGNGVSGRRAKHGVQAEHGRLKGKKQVPQVQTTNKQYSYNSCSTLVQ